MHHEEHGPRTRKPNLPMALGAALLLASCTGEKAELHLTGSSTVAPLVAELGRAYEATRPEVRITVQSGGSSRGIADARAGEVDLGMASRALDPDEDTELDAHTIARDGIALIVHADNPVAGLDADEVVGIYTGTIEDWSGVGGDDGAIAVVTKSSGRATLEVFLAHFDLAESDVDADVVIGENMEAIRTVGGNRRAIGFVSIGAAEQEQTRGAAIRLLTLDGVPATTATVADGSYPLYRPLNLLSRGKPGPLPADFIAFARTPEGRRIVERLHFVAPGD